MRLVRLPAALLGAAILAAGSGSRAAVVVVPDHFASLQQAVDSPAETVLVRAGDHPGRLLLQRPRDLRLAAHPENPPGSRPRIGALLMHRDAAITVAGCEFLGGVFLDAADGSDVRFEDCRLDSGFLQIGTGDTGNAGGVHLRRCTVLGDVKVLVSNAQLDADTLVGGGVAIDGIEAGIHVTSCVFRGSRAGTAILLQASSGKAAISGNTIEDYAVGIATSRAGHEMGSSVQRNAIRRCGLGIALGGEALLVAENEIRDCGRGIHVTSHRGATVDANRILDSDAEGIALLIDGDPAACRANVVGRSGGDGISIRTAYTSCDVRANTVYESGGAGIRILTDHEDDEIPVWVDRNVGYRNRGAGLAWANPRGVHLSCNDWFGNEGGAAAGVEIGATDLEVDPLFCDVARDSVGLNSVSPLLAAGPCGRIGALGLACDRTSEVLVALLVAERAGDGVRLRWRLGGDETPGEAWIERAPDAAGPWQRIATERTREGDATVDWDRDAPAARAWYRLAWIAASGEGRSHSIAAPITPGSSELALRVLGAHPGTGPVTIEYELPFTGPIRLEVYDIAGREVARLASGPVPSGVHRAHWDAGLHGGSAKPGLYFVRLRHPGGERTRRVVRR